MEYTRESFNIQKALYEQLLAYKDHEIERLENDSEDQIDELKDEVEGFEGDLADSEILVAELREELSSLEREIDDLEDLVGELEGRVSELEDQGEDLAKIHEEEISRLERDIS